MYNNTLIIFSSDNGGPADHANNYPFRGSKGSFFEGGTRVAAYISGGWLQPSLRGAHMDKMMHITDWYGTLSTLAGYTVDDPKAAAAKLPALDTLVVGNQGSFYPGPHMPNETDSNASDFPCGSGCLFNLTKDPVEHNNLAGDPRYADVLTKLIARQQYYFGTYFQSNGNGNTKDPKATAKAIANGGYWGPWLPNGTLPPPPPSPSPGPGPPPVPPVPPTGEGVLFTMKVGGVPQMVADGRHVAGTDVVACLTTTSFVGLQDSNAVKLGACDGDSKWELDLNNGGAIRTALHVKADEAYLRHVPPRGTCTTGTNFKTGMVTTDVFSLWDAGTNQIKSDNCNDPPMCAGPVTTAQGALIVLLPCSNTAQTTWTKVENGTAV
eukprot:gene12106-16616_t